MEGKVPKTRWSYVFKVISILIGLALIVLGIIDVFSFSITDPITVVLPVYYM